MISKTLSIGSRGQITLPKKLRDLFKTNTIVLELVDNQHAVISPVPDVGGAISEFKKETDFSFDEIRNNAWIDSTKAREGQR
jgi:bifunctional DNA-binding transcriptional regulator/antitoxin component of YhaV-PrlF toxin-antitoxin module